MHLAAGTGYASTVVLPLSHSPGLLDLKTVLADSNYNTDTALHIAVSEGHVKVVAELLARRPSGG
eukprot:CAMPEP_0202955236 /NCGR_PEP_ID=MMETSP1395-20130829/51615_1 /ASSEMBLY_ACC=CAM_ASM_000871 /TAXON_ID=5961 /ORGANISM="Blepharisma japonicum, Strain Stock R1072" /LENGTH=64 /DNA_ID=CAMNT_0049671569 /DNA_START=425 /DNA_END=619 /DNA_ORIENTATION=-